MRLRPTYDGYGYKENIQFKTMAEQKGTQFHPVKHFGTHHCGKIANYCQCGGELGDLVVAKD